jgi:hypothetical protein
MGNAHSPMLRIKEQDRRTVRKTEHQWQPRLIGNERISLRNRITVFPCAPPGLPAADPFDTIAMYLFRCHQFFCFQSQSMKEPLPVLPDSLWHIPYVQSHIQ